MLIHGDGGFVIKMVTTCPARLSQRFPCWFIRRLAAYLRRIHGHVIRIDCEALRCLLVRRGVTFQWTKTWKESPDPERDAKWDRVEDVLACSPDRLFAFDEFGSLSIRPTGGHAGPGKAGPRGIPRPITALMGCATSTGLLLRRRRRLVGRRPQEDGRREHAGRAEADPCGPPGRSRSTWSWTACPPAYNDETIRHWARKNRVGLCFTPAYVSWANPIEALFGPLRQFTVPTPTTVTTPRRPESSTPTCAGGSRTHGTPTC